MIAADAAGLRRLVAAALEDADPAAARAHPGVAAFVEGTGDVDVAELGLDSLGVMEFCIAIELSSGVPLVPNEVRELRTLCAVADSIRTRLP